MNDRTVSIRDLILVPSILTLAVTLLRLVGELQGWSPYQGRSQSIVQSPLANLRDPDEVDRA